jgi:hypothetical protein
MLEVSEQYKKEMLGLQRPQSHVRITYDFANNSAQSNAIFDRVNSVNFGFLNSNPQELLLRHKPQVTYITNEKNRVPLNGDTNFRIYPTSTPEVIEHDKMISNTLSRQDGTFATKPTVIFNFNTPQDMYAITMGFDYFGDSFPTDFELHFTNTNNQTEVLSVIDCESSEHILEGLVQDDIKTFKIVINTWNKPHQRARMGVIDFGITKVISNDELDESGVVYSRSVDLLSAELSYNEIDFTIDNQDGEFNALNPSGLWRHVRPNQKIILEYGLEIDDRIEWLKADTLFLDGHSTANGTTATFHARDKLNTIERECFGAPIEIHDSFYPRGIPLSRLASIIIDDYISDTGDDVRYKLDSCLDTMYTTARLEIMDIKEALQLIANAGHCILFTDRDGVITFKNALDPIITVNDNGGLSALSNSQRAFDDMELPTKSYVIADKNYNTLDGNMIIAGDVYEDVERTGFISRNVSGVNGAFLNPPEYIINYSIPTSMYDLPIVFNNLKNEYATRFSVTYYLHGRVVDTVNVNNNTQVRYNVLRNLDRVDRIIITINNWSKPLQRCVINQVNGGRVNDFHLDFLSAEQKPVVSNVDKIKQIDISFFVIQPGVETIEVEGYCSRVENGNAYYKITHEPIFDTVPSFDINVSVNGIYAMYPTCTEFSIRWTSSAEPPKVTLVGTKVEMVEHINSVVFNHEGVTKTFSNPLITTREQSELIARWLYDYIEKTSTFTVPYRGNPEIQPFDVIYLQSQFEDFVVSRVKSNTIHFNGGISGDMEVIKL